MPTPEERILELAPLLRWGGCHPALSDPIGMEFVIESDPAVRNQLMAARLETAAAVYRNLADGAAKAAQILAKSRG